MARSNQSKLYNTIWRWHFYAGLFCIPFILILSITGGIYLFKPEVEAVLDSAYDHLQLKGLPASPNAQVQAALAVVPNTVLNAYILPRTPESAVRVLVGRNKDLTRVYVHPETLEILKVEREDGKFMRVMHELHGNLLIGDRGSYVVELASSWAIVMIITGLYLWWPRSAGYAGVLYPRFTKTGRPFWRDLHGVVGFWVSFFTLFLLLSGMPWTKSWGGMLKEVRNMNAGKVVQQDWTTGRSSALEDRKISNTPMGDSGEHAEHKLHQHGESNTIKDYSAIDRLVVTVQPLHLAAPVLIAPPSKKSPDWTARSDAQNRPLRVNLVLDADSGAIKSRKNFADRPLFDRVIGIGVAVHEGQLFGWFNQALGVFTALGLVLLSISAIILWWKRRPKNTLGAPFSSKNNRLALTIVSIIVTLGVLLPFLGLSLLLVLAIERWVMPYFPGAHTYLGLDKRVV